MLKDSLNWGNTELKISRRDISISLSLIITSVGYYIGKQALEKWLANFCQNLYICTLPLKVTTPPQRGLSKILHSSSDLSPRNHLGECSLSQETSLEDTRCLPHLLGLGLPWVLASNQASHLQHRILTLAAQGACLLAFLFFFFTLRYIKNVHTLVYSLMNFNMCTHSCNVPLIKIPNFLISFSLHLFHSLTCPTLW